MIQNGILCFEIPNKYGPGAAKVRLGLEALAENAGKYISAREMGTGKQIRELQYSVSKTKRLCKLIAQYADPADFDAISECFKKNPKLMKIWEGVQ